MRFYTTLAVLCFISGNSTNVILSQKMERDLENGDAEVEDLTVVERPRQGCFECLVDSTRRCCRGMGVFGLWTRLDDRLRRACHIEKTHNC